MSSTNAELPLPPPPSLLWESLVKPSVPPSEHDEAERCVGLALVAANAALHAEAAALAEMLQVVAGANASAHGRLSLCSSARHEMAEAEILLLLEQLRRQQQQEEGQQDEAAACSGKAATPNEAHRRTIAFVESRSLALRRCSTTASSTSLVGNDLARPMSSGGSSSCGGSSSTFSSRPSTGSSSGCSGSDNSGISSIWACHEKDRAAAKAAAMLARASPSAAGRAWDPEGPLCRQLRLALRLEAAALGQGIARLQAALEAEAERCDAALCGGGGTGGLSTPPPSVADLKAAAAALKAEVEARQWRRRRLGVGAKRGAALAPLGWQPPVIVGRSRPPPPPPL